MTLALLGIRALLAIVFATAGGRKLHDRRPFTTTLAAFGVPTATAPLLAVVIPLIELVIAVLLLRAATAAAGALAAVVVLAVFTMAAVLTLAKGNAPDCACFGASTAEPIGAPTLTRNVVLIAIALIVTVFGPGDEIWTAATAWRAASIDERTLSTMVVALLVLLGGVSVHASRLRGDNARLAARVAALQKQPRAVTTEQDLGAGGLEKGAPAPPFDLPRLEGDRGSLKSLTANGRPVALVFLSGHCPACHELWPDIERWQRHQHKHVTVAAICGGSPQTIEMKLMGFSVSNVLLEGDAHVADAYALSLRPSVVIVSPAGVIASPSVAGVGAIRALVEKWARGEAND